MNQATQAEGWRAQVRSSVTDQGNAAPIARGSTHACRPVEKCGPSLQQGSYTFAEMAKAAVQRPRKLASPCTLVLCCAFFWAAPGPAQGTSEVEAGVTENGTNETAANETITTEMAANSTGANGSVVAASSEATSMAANTTTTNTTSTTSTTSTTNGTSTTVTTNTTTTTTTTVTTNTTTTTTTTTTTNTSTTTTTTRTTNTTTTTTTTTTTNTSDITTVTTVPGGATNYTVVNGSASQATTTMGIDFSNMSILIDFLTGENLSSTTTQSENTTSTSTAATVTTTTATTTTATTLSRTLPKAALALCSAEVLDALNQALSEEVRRYAIIGLNLDCQHYDGEYVLHRALRLERNDIALTIIRVLPSSSAQLHEPSREGSTPLQMATENRIVEGVQLLLEKGADATLFDTEGRTALHLGATHLGITNLLLTLSGVDNATLLSKFDNDGDQPLHIALRGVAPDSAILMVESADSTVGKAYAAQLVQVVNGDGDYPIHLCSRADLFKLLIKYKASLQVRNREGAVPLHTASRWPGTSADGVLALLSGNVSVNVPDNYGRTPLHYAAETGNLANVLWLINQGAHIFVRDRNGEVPLVYALRERHVELTPVLAGDMSPLHTVVALGYFDYLTDMVINQSFPVEALDEDNRSALFMAVESGRMDITNFLVAMGADVDRRDNHGLTVLAVGVAASQEETSMYIMERGADIFQRIQNFSTHLHVAARVGNEFLVAELMRRGADVNTKDFRGFTPLHFSGSAIVAEAMLRAGAKTFESFRDRLVPIHTAVLNGHLEVLRALMVWRSSGVDTANNNGMTSLHLAVIAQRADLVAELLKWCASTVIENKEGRDPIQYAHDSEIITLLRDAELATDRCQCDCPTYAPGPMYVTSDWNGSCRATIKCRLQLDIQSDEVHCAAIRMPPIFSSLQNNFTGAWKPPQPNLRCPTGSVSTAWGGQGVTAALRAAMLLLSVSSLITSSF